MSNPNDDDKRLPSSSTKKTHDEDHEIEPQDDDNGGRRNQQAKRPRADAASELQSDASASTPASLLAGTDIAQILSSTGPVVTCVLLKHMRSDGRDTKPHHDHHRHLHRLPPTASQGVTSASETSSSEGKDAGDEATGNSSSGLEEDTNILHHHHHRPVLTELIEEIQIDTTPSKNQVKQVLGGPFTFLGQYPDEGIVVMARQDLPDDLESQSVHALRQLCHEAQLDVSGLLEKQELVSALLEAQLPVNPHRLQPPLDGLVVRGDILLMKVAETEEELDQPPDEEEGEVDGDEDGDHNGDETGVGDDKPGDETDQIQKRLKIPSNEEFFLNYTKDEYVAFASRTDIVAPDEDDGEEGDEEEGEGDDEAEAGEEEEEDEAFSPVEDVIDDEDSEECRRAMLNLILGEILKRFRHENGRGPDTEELLELRSQVAAELGVELATVPEQAEHERNGGESYEDRRRKRVETALEQGTPKRVKFVADEAPATNGSREVTEGEANDEEHEDGKPVARGDEPNGDANP